MQDKQTSTYWSLMKGAALEGELKGEMLEELPIGEKMKWKDWAVKYPNTKVLSVNSRQDARAGYERYFNDSEGFRGLKAKDDRLETKAPVFAFHYNGTPQAIAYSKIQNGVSIELDPGKHLFLYRDAKDELFRSTTALVSKQGFERVEDVWKELESGVVFDVQTRTFENQELESMNGFDTFWYNWSLNNPDTKLLMP